MTTPSPTIREKIERIVDRYECEAGYKMEDAVRDIEAELKAEVERVRNKLEGCIDYPEKEDADNQWAQGRRHAIKYALSLLTPQESVEGGNEKIFKEAINAFDEEAERVLDKGERLDNHTQ